MSGAVVDAAEGFVRSMVAVFDVAADVVFVSRSLGR